MLATSPYRRPDPAEYPPYYGQYVSQVPDGDLLAILRAQIGGYQSLLGPVPESRGDHAYAPGKWSIKQVVGHVIDAERVFTYRALTFGRNDPGPLPSFDENAWIGPGEFGRRTLADLLEEFVAVRGATIHLLAHLPPEAPDRVGTASGKPISVRALAYIAAGHAAHHARVLAERYL